MADREGLTFAMLRSLRNALRVSRIVRYERPRQSNPMLRKGSRPPPERQDPSPERLDGGLGGQGGIRTLGDIAATHAFQACSFDHSDTCPLVVGAQARRLNPEWQPDFGKCRRFFQGTRFCAMTAKPRLSHRDILSALAGTKWRNFFPFPQTNHQRKV